MTRVCVAAVRPVSDFARINIRQGPGTHYPVTREIAVVTAQMAVREVRPDERGSSVNGRVYQWFRLALPDGSEGWVRDDLIEIEGACAAFGYGDLALPQRASTLARDPRPATPPGGATPLDEAAQTRIRLAAFSITAAFEGGGYDTYQTYDSGIVSYGRFQCTLASGGLEKLLEQYLTRATGSSADQLRLNYMPRIRSRDPELRADAGLRTLLQRLARDPLMQEAQNAYVTQAYWNAAFRQRALPRGMRTPLGLAMIFDMAIHHGNWRLERDYLRPAEQTLGASIRSVLGQNGLSEQQLLRRAAQIRRDRLYALAAARGLAGLRPRADFWLARIDASDWDLQGDARGEVEIKSGLRVQVKAPR